MKENKNNTNNKWGALVKKKWFFPAIYLTVAALLLSVVVWYQNIGNQLPEAEDQVGDEYVPNLHDEDAASVAEQSETVIMPVEDPEKSQVVTKFFDYDAEEKEQQAGLILHNNRYYQSTGVGIQAKDEKGFDVVAALSGEVKEVKEDPLLGNIVVMSHANEVETYYASLGEVFAEVGDKVDQGDTIASAGKNLFTKDNGTHVHFEIHKDGTEVNPEAVFNQPVSKLDELVSEMEAEKTIQDEEAPSTSKELEEELNEEDESKEAEEETSEKSDSDFEIDFDDEDDEDKKEEDAEEETEDDETDEE